MALAFENYGLNLFADEQEHFEELMHLTTRAGKPLIGYHGTPYFFLPMGGVEFWEGVEKDGDGNLFAASFHTHCGNKCIWNMSPIGIDITPKNTSNMERVAMFCDAKTQTGMVPIEVITADVLPSYIPDDEIKMQVVAIPLALEYHADEDAYEQSLPRDENGDRWGLKLGTLNAFEFLKNHAPEQYEQGKEYPSDHYVHFAAVVKSLRHGIFEMGDEQLKTFIRCFVDTQFGELEFDHTLEQVPEEQRKNIKVGSVITGVCVLSADVAIGDYENGIVKDFDHNLRLIASVITEGDAERMISILIADAIYETDSYQQTYTGVQAIVDRFMFVHEHRDKSYEAYYATITQTEDVCLEYPVGTRCIVLKSEDEDGYESIVFLTVNEEGMVTKIKVCTDTRYRFQVDKPRQASVLDDYEFPNSIEDAIVLRAKLYGMIDEDEESVFAEEMTTTHVQLEENVQNMLDALQAEPQEDAEKALMNILGYLFAKAMECEANNTAAQKDYSTKLLASYAVQDAFQGTISSTLCEEDHQKLEKAMELGRRFFLDFKIQLQMTEPQENQFMPLFKRTAVLIQCLGQAYWRKTQRSNGKSHQ
ncbi:MAG: hypothetical protein J6L88_02105 [Clostridia bacterium]|nr:hypothetical protein [Clostridia bacterium]